MVNVKGESDVNREKWMTEKTRLGSRTITIPPSKSCTSGTTSQPLWISIVKDNSLAGVLQEGAITDNVSWVVTKGTSPVWTDTGEVTEAPAKRTVVTRATVLGVAWSCYGREPPYFIFSIFPCRLHPTWALLFQQLRSGSLSRHSRRSRHSDLDLQFHFFL